LLVYFALWLAIPKAHFLVAIVRAIDPGIHSGHQPLATILAICGIIVLSIPTVTFMAAQISVIYYFSKQRLEFKGALLWLGISLASLVGIVIYMLWRLDVVAKLHRLPTTREIGFIVSMSRFDTAKMLMYGAILLVACSIGYLVSLRIKDKNLLLPVVMFAASIDFWTVTVGPVSSMMKHAPEIVSAISAPIPKAGTGAFVAALTMGMGDPLFMALVFAAVHRLGMNSRRNFGFVCVIMTLGMLAVMMGGLPYLPALVALAVAVVAGNWREFKLSRQEKISTALVAVVLLGTLPLVWAILRPHNRAPHPEHPERVEGRSGGKTDPRLKPTAPVSAPRQSP
jgi:hypothetical protein